MISEKMDALFQGLIDEHRSKKESSNTMIDHLLSFQESQPEYYTDQIIEGLIMAMMVTRTETSAITIEWALSNLLNHPQVLEKARMELDKVFMDKNSLLDNNSSTWHFTAPKICLNYETLFSNCLWELVQFSTDFHKFSSFTKSSKHFLLEPSISIIAYHDEFVLLF
ncbi:hypothetical protein HN873_012625 [Arachis hypogaea]